VPWSDGESGKKFPRCTLGWVPQEEFPSSIAGNNTKLKTTKFENFNLSGLDGIEQLINQSRYSKLLKHVGFMKFLIILMSKKEYFSRVA